MKQTNVRISILLFLFLFFTAPTYSEIWEAQVVTDGDYGLELDWAYPLVNKLNFGIYVDYMISDSENNLYVGGKYHEELIFPDGKTLTAEYPDGLCSYIAKITPEGEILWTLNFTGEFSKDIQKMLMSPTGDLLVFYFVERKSDSSLYLNGTPIYEIAKEGPQWFDLLMKFDTETGSLVDMVELGSSSTYDNYLVLDQEGNIYYHTLIDKNFTALDKERLPTTARCKGYEDVYIAKITPDFNLAWDMVLGGTGHENPYTPTKYYKDLGYPYSYGNGTSNGIIVVKDTLYIKMGYFSPVLDIDPDPEKEVFVFQTRTDNDCLFAKYLTSGDRPKLLAYKTFDSPHPVPSYFYANSKGKIGGYTYLNSAAIPNKFRYTIHPDLTWTEDNSYPYIGDARNWDLQDHYYYDRNDNLIVPHYAFRGGYGGTLQVTFSEKNNKLTYSTQSSAVYYMAKYDTTYAFRWGLILGNISLVANHVTAENGAIYMGGDNSYRNRDMLDLDPNPDKIVNLSSPSIVAIMAKYVETYKVTLKENEYAQLKASKEFIRHGTDLEIEVVPDENYQIQSVVTSDGIVLQEKGENRYLLENVTKPETVSAILRNETTDSEALQSNTPKIKLYPNPAKEEIYLNREVNRIEVCDAVGTRLLHQEGVIRSVRVEGLPSGLYLLKATDAEGNVFNCSFIKQ